MVSWRKRCSLVPSVKTRSKGRQRVRRIRWPGSQHPDPVIGAEGDHVLEAQAVQGRDEGAAMKGPRSPSRLSANTTLKRKPTARNSSTISMANCGLVL